MQRLVITLYHQYFPQIVLCLTFLLFSNIGVQADELYYGKPIVLSAAMSIENDNEKATKVTSNLVEESADKDFNEILDDLFDKNEMKAADSRRRIPKIRPKPFLNAHGQIDFYTPQYGPTTQKTTRKPAM